MRLFALAATGAAWGALSECGGGKNQHCDEGLDMGPLPGMLAGVIPGAFIHTTTAVYPLPEKRVSVLPAISGNAVGLRASLRW